ncbi:MAG: alkyl hydroperoxide reductase subunit F [Bdellovibrionaceae bacterium]|nr:alkyl hydroperoxide reductase subunit F [Pseudobdellovibrionaceae bacterium]
MLDTSILEQLKTVFEKLEDQVDLVYDESAHEDQKDLLEILGDVASTSPLIVARPSGQVSSFPKFEIYRKSVATGIIFKALPSGHEFTTLIVGILNADGKGKMPDDVLAQRIRRLKKNIHLQTYISLTCENCPDVVQSLNQIVLIHGSFTHEIIDGGYVQQDIQTLGIQGVPSLVANQKLIHSGRIQLLDLVQKLEETFGIDESIEVKPVDEHLGHFDVVVVGGGPAGVSAAIYSVRKGLSTALITEKMGGQVQETKGIENLISVVYTEGPQLAAKLHEHVTSYPVQVLEHRRVKSITKGSKPKHIELESGETLSADSVIIATGAKWRELGVEGEKEYIGRGVAFCPHCDGPYYKGKSVAVIGGGNSGVEAAIDLAGIVKDVTVFEYNENLKADQILVDKLKALPNVKVVTQAKTLAVLGDGQKVTALKYEKTDSKEVITQELDGVFVQIGLVPNSQFLKGTLELTTFGEIPTDEKGRTSEKGIYAAGDVTTTPYKQIIISMGEGAKAALAAFEDRMYQ